MEIGRNSARHEGQREWGGRVVTEQRVISQVNQFLQEALRCERIRMDYPLLVAVSGGVDSMVLLHAMARCSAELQLSVRVVHIDHAIRPTSAKDAEFVLGVCQAWGIPARVRKIHMDEIPHHVSKGVEADARALRYRELVAEAVECGAQSVFLAHHADDQVETVLWRLVRGTSPRGIGGMHDVSHRAGLEWMRPLLQMEKAELQAYASTYQVPYTADETNESTEYTRNYIRIEVVPRLKKMQPNLIQRIADFTELAREEDDYLHRVSQCWITDHTRQKGSDYWVPIAHLLELARPLQRRAIHILLYCLASENWTRAHVESILALAQASSPSAKVHLPKDLRVQREYGWLRMGPELEPQMQAFRISWRLAAGAALTLPVDSPGQRWSFSCQQWAPEEAVQNDSLYQAVLPEVTEVTIESAKTSIRIEKMGMNGSKKLQDVFVDAKVPRHQRAMWPVLEYDGRVIWIPGLARSRHLLVDPGDKKPGWRIVAEPPNQR